MNGQFILHIGDLPRYILTFETSSYFSCEDDLPRILLPFNRRRPCYAAKLGLANSRARAKTTAKFSSIELARQVSPRLHAPGPVASRRVWSFPMTLSLLFPLPSPLRHYFPRTRTYFKLHTNYSPLYPSIFSFPSSPPSPFSLSLLSPFVITSLILILNYLRKMTHFLTH